MWKATHSATVKAPAGVIWKYWTNVDAWPEYDASLKAAKLDGSFDMGKTISLWFNDMPKMKARLALVTPGVGFACVSKLPLATVQFTYHIDELESSSAFTQSVNISGPLWWLYTRLFGEKMEASLKARVEKLAEIINQESEQTVESVD